jgi:membrane carboxypeptidase/penicillin-binding protein
MREIIELIAKFFYKKDYYFMRVRLLKEYELVKNFDNSDFDILSKLLISGEDHRFFHHIGFDVIAILRAIKNNFCKDRIEGASTIEQQLVRVLINDFDKTIRRKVKEIMLATTVMSLVPKRVIPIIYLNVAYYGPNMYGLDQVMNRLKVTKQNKLTLEIAAGIISRIKYPQPEDPSPKRIMQIERRKKHLLSLYDNHLKRKYFKVYG